MSDEQRRRVQEIMDDFERQGKMDGLTVARAPQVAQELRDVRAQLAAARADAERLAGELAASRAREAALVEAGNRLADELELASWSVDSGSSQRIVHEQAVRDWQALRAAQPAGEGEG